MTTGAPAPAVVSCKNCRKPIVRCETLPSHCGCSSAYGWIHAGGGAHDCIRRSGPVTRAQPEETR
jgi:hypothetical protein